MKQGRLPKLDHRKTRDQRERRKRKIANRKAKTNARNASRRKGSK